ncbi:MAG: VOC family protein [Gracilimonas sp.]|nr:VOC family protein [Gracilimonas sp.]
MSNINPFHLAFPVKDLDEAYKFYHDLLGCETGRSSDSWIDFNMWGHQVVAHLSPEEAKGSAMNAVDGKGVPVRHFGVILEMDEWKALAEKLEKERDRICNRAIYPF